MPDFGMMTPQHVIYIPSMLLVGLIVGYTMGARAVRNELVKRKNRLKE